MFPREKLQKVIVTEAPRDTWNLAKDQTSLGFQSLLLKTLSFLTPKYPKVTLNSYRKKLHMLTIPKKMIKVFLGLPTKDITERPDNWSSPPNKPIHNVYTIEQKLPSKKPNFLRNFYPSNHLKMTRNERKSRAQNKCLSTGLGVCLSPFLHPIKKMDVMLTHSDLHHKDSRSTAKCQSHLANKDSLRILRLPISKPSLVYRTTDRLPTNQMRFHPFIHPSPKEIMHTFLHALTNWTRWSKKGQVIHKNATKDRLYKG